MIFHTSYEESELVDLVLELNDLVKLAPERKYATAIYEKYFEVNLQYLENINFISRYRAYHNFDL